MIPGLNSDAGALLAAAHVAAWSSGAVARGALRVVPGTAKDGDRLRILYIRDDDYPWDVRVEKICSALTEHGHDVHIAAKNVARAPTLDVLPEGTVHRMQPWPWLGRRLDAALAFPAFFSPRWMSMLVRTARRIRPHVLIVRDLPLAPTAIWAGQLLAVPVVLDMAENYPAMLRTTWDAGLQRPWDVAVRNPSLARAVERWALKRIDRVLVVVEESAERLRRAGVPADRIDVVSNTPPLAQLARWGSAPKTRGAQSLELVYLGYLEVPRGIGEVIDAVGRLRGEGHGVTLSLIGDGRDAPRFRAQARALGLDESAVRFLGYLPHEEALDVLARADVGVVPHVRSEYWDTTIPNKLFDYMAAGLPVVSSDAAPSARIVGQTGAGEVYRSGDVESLVAAILRLKDPIARARHAERGREAIVARYNWERDAAVLCGSVARAAEEVVGVHVA